MGDGRLGRRINSKIRVITKIIVLTKTQIRRNNEDQK